MSNLKSNIIAHITDFGANGQHYVACMKGAILNINSRVKLVDISHDIAPFSIIESNYVIYSTFRYFPSNTIFLAVIDPGVGSLRKIVAIRTKSNHYFIGPDNGVFTYIIEKEDVLNAVEISNNEYFLKPISETFHGRDIMAPIAAYLSKGGSMEDFGPNISTNDLIKIDNLHPKINEQNLIEGKIQYIDDFGNVITNIELDSKNKSDILGVKFSKEDSYTLIVSDSKYKGVFLTHYAKFDTNRNKNLLIFKRDSFNFLELSLNRENLAAKLNISIGDIFYIKIE